VSGSLITPAEIDTPVDFNSLARIEAGPGSGSIVVLSEDRCIVDITKIFCISSGMSPAVSARLVELVQRKCTGLSTEFPKGLAKKVTLGIRAYL